MSDWEQTDALLHWLATFDLDSDDFIQDPNKLRDGKVFATVYNKIASDQIDISKLSVISKESDWIYMLLNLRQIASHITPLLKENGFDLSVDLNSLVRKKDQNELLKFLKYFLFFSVKAPNRKISITGIRSLDKTYQIHIQTILEEFTSKKNQQDQETAARLQKQQAQKAVAESIIQKQKLQKLHSEIEELKAKSAEKEKEIKMKSQEVEHLDSDIINQMQSAMNEVNEKYEKESKIRETLLAELKQKEDSVQSIKKQIELITAQNQSIEKQLKKFEVPERKQLDSKLSIVKNRALYIIDDEVKNKDKKSLNVDEIVSYFHIPEKQSKMDQLKENVDNFDKIILMKRAELDAMKSQLDEQNKKNSIMLLRRVAQLNAEMDASPLGEAKRKLFQLRRVIDKLGRDIDKLEKDSQNFELSELRKEINKMEKLKNEESELLARKLDFMTATAQQGSLRLQRLKLHVGFQMNSNRLKRWKNCFTAGLDQPKTS